MSGAIKINGTSSGSTTITAPASGGDETIELSTVLAGKGDVAGETWTGTHDFTGATVTGAGSLILVATASLTGSSVSINNCFTSSYQNYRIVANCELSGYNQVVFRLRASGSDATGSDYYERYITSGAAGTSVTANGVVSSSARFALAGSFSPYAANFVADILSPQATSRTYVNSMGFPSYVATLSTMHNLTTAYDGLTIYTDTGTFSSGTVRVYAYQGV